MEIRLKTSEELIEEMPFEASPIKAAARSLLKNLPVLKDSLAFKATLLSVSALEEKQGDNSDRSKDFLHRRVLEVLDRVGIHFGSSPYMLTAQKMVAHYCAAGSNQTSRAERAFAFFAAACKKGAISQEHALESFDIFVRLS